MVGALLWFCLHAAGVQATLAGVLLALFIPTRPPPNLSTLMIQAGSIMEAEAEHNTEVPRQGPSIAALRALDSIHDRLESPADRMLRTLAPRSSYIVLPLFALANAGVALNSSALIGRGGLILAITTGLVVGKPLGLWSASRLAVWLGLATKPDMYSWTQLVGAGALAGIGFTMSLCYRGPGIDGSRRLRCSEDWRFYRFKSLIRIWSPDSLECQPSKERRARISLKRARVPLR
jgi:NhaA family Na+:H+ antiporter